MCMKETMQLQSIITKLAKDTGTTILPVVHWIVLCVCLIVSLFSDDSVSA
jgi:hypothetical protein